MILLAALALAAASAVAEDRPDPTAAAEGGRLFRIHCASCHGKEARGDGPLADVMRVVPPDLTGLARRNRGAFPMERVVRLIDGREHVAGHGDSGMPIWGDAFLDPRSGFDGRAVKDRIRALAEYLASIQESGRASR